MSSRLVTILSFATFTSVVRFGNAGVNALGTVKVLNGERSALRPLGFRIEPQGPHAGEAVAVRGEVHGVTVGRKLLFVVVVFAAGELDPPVRSSGNEVLRRCHVDTVMLLIGADLHHEPNPLVIPGIVGIPQVALRVG